MRKLRTWPWKGPVLITEAGSEDAGSIFIVDNWVLTGAYRYEGQEYSPLVESGQAFDYDTYKILVRYMLDPKHRSSMRTLAKSEHEELMARLLGDDVSYVVD